jgi:prevent-host-death family protein
VFDRVALPLFASGGGASFAVSPAIWVSSSFFFVSHWVFASPVSFAQSPSATTADWAAFSDTSVSHFVFASPVSAAHSAGAVPGGVVAAGAVPDEVGAGAVVGSVAEATPRERRNSTVDMVTSLQQTGWGNRADSGGATPREEERRFRGSADVERGDSDRDTRVRAGTEGDDLVQRWVVPWLAHDLWCLTGGLNGAVATSDRTLYKTYIGGAVSRSISVSDARANLARLVEEAAAGEEIVLTRAGRPMARIVPLAPETSRVRGLWRGRGHLGEDFDAPLPDEWLDAFEGRRG